jgi:ribokinase
MGTNSSGGAVVVVGSANMDHIVQVADLPRPGETVTASSYHRAAGGKGLNQAVAAARQGAAVAMVACLGVDSAGDHLLDVLVAADVDIRFVRRDGKADTGTALVTVADGGSNTVVVAAGCNHLLGTADISAAESALGRATAVLVQLEVPGPAVEQALRRGRAAGAITILNPAPAAGPLSPSVLSAVDVLVPNETEAVALTGLAAEEAGPALLGPGNAAVIVTLGERGALVATPGRLDRVAPLVIEAVDTTAAGDAFCGTLAAQLAGLGRHRPEQAASIGLPTLLAMVRRACAAGALAATVLGAVPSLPDVDAVERLLQVDTG